MALNTVVAGVIGYPAKKRHPAAMAPRAMASFPSIKHSGILGLRIEWLYFDLNCFFRLGITVQGLKSKDNVDKIIKKG
jgi:hypothetical protein